MQSNDFEAIFPDPAIDVCGAILVLMESTAEKGAENDHW